MKSLLSTFFSPEFLLAFFLAAIVWLPYAVLTKIKFMKENEIVPWRLAFSCLSLGFFSITFFEANHGFLHDISGKLILAGIMFFVIDIWMHRSTQAEIIRESKVASEDFREKAVREVRLIAEGLKDLAIAEAEKAAEKVKEAAEIQAFDLKKAALSEIENTIGQATQKIVDARISREIQHAIEAIGAHTPLSFSYDMKIDALEFPDGLSVDVEEKINVKNTTSIPQKFEFKRRISHRSVIEKVGEGPTAVKELQFDAPDILYSYTVRPGEDIELIIKHFTKTKELSEVKKYLFPFFTVGANKYRVFSKVPTDVAVDCVLLGTLSNHLKYEEWKDSDEFKNVLHTINCPILPYTPIILTFRKKLPINPGEIGKDSLVLGGGKNEKAYISDVDE